MNWLLTTMISLHHQYHPLPPRSTRCPVPNTWGIHILGICSRIRLATKKKNETLDLSSWWLSHPFQHICLIIVLKMVIMNNFIFPNNFRVKMQLIKSTTFQKFTWFTWTSPVWKSRKSSEPNPCFLGSMLIVRGVGLKPPCLTLVSPLNQPPGNKKNPRKQEGFFGANHRTIWTIHLIHQFFPGVVNHIVTVWGKPIMKS